MLPLQLVLRPERAESSWPSPPRNRSRRRNSSSSPTRRGSNSRPRQAPLLLCSMPFTGRAPSGPKLSPRRRSGFPRNDASVWGSVALLSSGVLALPRICIKMCSALLEAATTTAISLVDRCLGTVIGRWWYSADEETVVETESSSALHFFDRRSTGRRSLQDVLDENDRLRRTLQLAAISHSALSEATEVLSEDSTHWMLLAEGAVDAKVREAERECEELARQLANLDGQFGDKEQDLDRWKDDLSTDCALYLRPAELTPEVMTCL